MVRERISNVNEFAEYVSEHLFDESPEMTLDHTVQVQSVTKNNGLILKGIVVRENGCNIAPTLYVNDAFKRFEDGEDIQSLMDELLRAYDLHKLTDDFSVEFFTDFEQAKERLAMKLINAERNRELLATVPHYLLGDLAVIFQVLVDATEFGNATITVRNEHRDMWDVPTSTLFSFAKANMEEKQPVRIQSMFEALSGMIGNDDLLDVMDMPPMFVMSNESKINAAVGMLFTDKLQEFAEKYNSSLYIIPSSIHELLLIPDRNQDPDSLASMIVEVNSTQVSPEEVLSDHPYFYDMDTHELKFAETMEVMELIEV